MDRLVKTALIVGLLLIVNGWPFPVQAQSSVSREYQLKAAFIYNFCQFVNWPEASFQNTNNTLVIAVVGENPFGNVLTELVKNQQIGGRKVVVKRASDLASAAESHIIFVPSNYRFGMDEWKTKGSSNALIIGESDSFLDKGGMIRFYTADNKLKFQVHLDKVQEQDFKISSKLLKMATLY
ncbi:YfiR family protein [Luteibaculum oceani]|uniref:YfiR family protein n=1 Tax=Luteibaculum oceani TaxID=1294296 RepID=A0A5C6V888_9FLAO|nr:YfiR family protein [Luteibaculum oceani]TXC81553.1 YfiR family protein [Luteibaculum oceani]